LCCATFRTKIYPHWRHQKRTSKTVLVALVDADYAAIMTRWWPIFPAAANVTQVAARRAKVLQ